MSIGFVFSLAGVPFTEGDIETTVKVLTGLAGAIMTLWGRYRAGGVTAFGFRSK